MLFILGIMKATACAVVQLPWALRASNGNEHLVRRNGGLHLLSVSSTCPDGGAGTAFCPYGYCLCSYLGRFEYDLSRLWFSDLEFVRPVVVVNCTYCNHCNCNHCNDCSLLNSCNHCNHCNHCSHLNHCNCNCCNCCNCSRYCNCCAT